MKKNQIKFVFIFLLSLSVFSSIYLNKLENSDSNVMIEIQEMKNTNDQLITNIKFVTIVVDRVVDIITTRRS